MLNTTINNSGTINRIVNTGSSSIAVLNNTGGTIDVQAGTLIPWNGNGSVSTGGLFEAATGATLLYNPGDNSNNTFTGTYTGSGGGQFVLNSDVLTIGTGGATFDFPSGFFQWIGGGQLAATAGTLTNTGFITVDTSNGSSTSFAGTLNNQGTIIVQNTGNTPGVFSGGTINNPASGIIDIDGIDRTASGPPLLNTTINNSGTINRVVNTGSSSIAVLNNSGGTIDVQAGTLIPWNGNGSVSTGGLFEAATGATIQYNPGDNSNNTFTGTYTGSGGGQFVLNSDVLTIGTGGATFDFPSGFFQWIGGGQLAATAGTLTNTGFITVDTSNGSSTSFAGTLNNQGTIIVQNTGNTPGVFSGGTINNPASGIIDIDGIDRTASGPPLLNTTINNSGTINRVVNTGSSSIAVLNNSGGTIDVQAGTLIPWNGNGSVSTGGLFEAATGATLLYNPGDNSNNTFTGTYTGSGGGQFVLNSDVLTIGTGGATFDFPSGFFQWIGGGQLAATAGTLTNTGFITVDTSDGSSTSFAGTLNNQGTITVQNTGNNTGVFSGGTLNNTAAGIINIDGIDGTGHGTPLLNTTVNNAGAITANILTTATINRLSNTGSVTVQSGTLSVNSVAQISGAALTGGTWNVLGGSTLNLQNGVPLTTNDAIVLLDGAGSSFANFVNKLTTNGGSFTVQDGATFTTPGALGNSGVVIVGNNGSILTITGNFTQSGAASQTYLQGGTLKSLTSTVTVNGGSVTGAGTIQGNVINNALFDPGTGTGGGTIAITGNDSQTSMGVLDIGLGGTAAGQFGQLAVGGSATLNGTLSIILLDNFVPTDTDLFQAVTYAMHSGTFPTINGTSLPNNQTLTTNYTSSNLTLGVTADVTSQVNIALGGLRVNRATRQVAQTVTITNTGSSAIAGAISFVLDNLTAGVTLVGATGTTQQVGTAGSPYINVLPAGTPLGVGQSITVNLVFNDPGLVSFTYKPRVLAGLGQR